MSHVSHELSQEFPNDAARIHALKGSDRHFARLVEEYHEINRAIHRYETRVEPVSEEHEAAARRERACLKDQIAGALAQAA